MPYFDWFPVEYRPLVYFLLQFGLVSVAYSWIVLSITSVIGMIWRMLRIPGDLGTFIKVTLGHPMLALVTILVLLMGITAEPSQRIFYTIIACAFLWVTLAPELYEDYGRSPSAQSSRSRLLFAVRLLLIIVWTAAVAASAMGNWFTTLIERPEWWFLVFLALKTSQLIVWIFALPYFLGLAAGTFGAYSLFRSLFKALFATFGLLGELRHVSQPRSDLPSVGPQ
ncbi:MAG: hypothetical protein HOO67_02080 [Candidatus Peribacteraceae bacterium]|nr:hypothetical protein [Candidatus Peribacteraceae bacterium]